MKIEDDTDFSIASLARGEIKEACDCHMTCHVIVTVLGWNC